MALQSRTLWQRYVRPESRRDAILRVVPSLAVILVVGWRFSVSLATVVLAGLLSALGLLLSGFERVRNLRKSSGRE